MTHLMYLSWYIVNARTSSENFYRVEFIQEDFQLFRGYWRNRFERTKRLFVRNNQNFIEFLNVKYTISLLAPFSEKKIKSAESRFSFRLVTEKIFTKSAKRCSEHVCVQKKKIQ